MRRSAIHRYSFPWIQLTVSKNKIFSGAHQKLGSPNTSLLIALTRSELARSEMPERELIDHFIERKPISIQRWWESTEGVWILRQPYPKRWGGFKTDSVLWRQTPNNCGRVFKFYATVEPKSLESCRRSFINWIIQFVFKTGMNFLHCRQNCRSIKKPTQGNRSTRQQEPGPCVTTEVRIQIHSA